MIEAENRDNIDKGTKHIRSLFSHLGRKGLAPDRFIVVSTYQNPFVRRQTPWDYFLETTIVLAVVP